MNQKETALVFPKSYREGIWIKLMRAASYKEFKKSVIPRKGWNKRLFEDARALAIANGDAINEMANRRRQERIEAFEFYTRVYEAWERQSENRG